MADLNELTQVVCENRALNQWGAEGQQYTDGGVRKGVRAENTRTTVEFVMAAHLLGHVCRFHLALVNTWVFNCGRGVA